jgi:cytochrome c biogenesis protein CcdA
VQCPLCEYAWPDGTPICLRCHYDFENRDGRLALSRLRRQSLTGNSMWFAGTALIFFSFAVLFGLAPTLGVVFGGAMMCGGVMLVAFGLGLADEAKKRLTKAKERMQLPPARVL